MRDATPRPLYALRNRATRYEVAATHPDGRRVVVGFTLRTSALGLLIALHGRGEELVELTGTDEVLFLPRAMNGGRWAVRAGEWTLGFSGRTEREVTLSLSSGGTNG